VNLTFAAGNKPNIRKGSWILDTTYVPNAGKGTGSVNGYFYQVANTTDVDATTVSLELESNLRANLSNVVVMENVITVLERGTAWKP